MSIPSQIAGDCKSVHYVYRESPDDHLCLDPTVDAVKDSNMNPSRKTVFFAHGLNGSPAYKGTAVKEALLKKVSNLRKTTVTCHW